MVDLTKKADRFSEITQSVNVLRETIENLTKKVNEIIDYINYSRKYEIKKLDMK